MKWFKKVLIALWVAFLLWLWLSYADVNAHNRFEDDGDPQPWNFFTIVFSEVE